jgi:hypothetical protein
MKNFFNTKSIRERVLMTGLLLIAMMVWGSSLLGRTRLFKTEWQTSAVERDEQLTWMNNKAQVEERTAKATAQLDPSRTLNAARAFSEVNQLAQGLSPEIGSPRTDPTENFAMHSFQVTIRRTDLRQLGKFYLGLNQKAPYLGIDQCTISLDRATPGQLSAVFRIYSVEVLSPKF